MILELQPCRLGVSKSIVSIFQENNLENDSKADMKIKMEQERLWKISCKNKENIMSKIF